MSHSPETLLDRPDRKLLLVGRGFNLSKPIGQQALDLTGVERPKNVLVIPSPANNPKAYKRYIGEPRKVFGELGAKVKVLHGNPTSKTFKDPSAEQIANMVGEADVLWISGGNTTQARELFERTGLGKEILGSQGKVISGGSAGALLQAKQGFSWYTPENHPELNEWVTEHGTGMLNAIVNVHGDYIEYEPWHGGIIDQPRYHYFEPYLMEQWTQGNPDIPELGIGIDDESAIAFAEGGFRVVNGEGTNPDRGVTSYHTRDSGLVEARFTPATTQNFISLDHLRPAV